jgi:hypothetical protein
MPYRTADGTPTDQEGVQFANGALGARYDFLGRERQGTTPAPTVAVGTAAGTSATVTVHTGTDSHGTVTITSGASGWSGHPLATITFANAYTGTNPPIVQIEPKDAGAANLYYATCTNTVLTINLVTTPSTATTWAFDYFVVGGA